MHAMRFGLAALLFALSTANLFGQDTNKMVLRCYSVRPFCGTVVQDTNAPMLEQTFEMHGVKFPKGSFIKLDEGTLRLCMFNTEENHDKIKPLLYQFHAIDTSIELDASFITFDLQDIEDEARKNLSAAPTTTQIAELWKSGKGHLLGTHKLITRSGVNAQSQGVDEYIYPTAFVPAVPTNASAAQTPGANVLPTPDAFETREIGMVFNITPTVQPDGKTLDLVLAPELTDGEAWDDITTTLSRGENDEENLIVRQPRFHTAKLTTTIAVEDGATVIMGGMASRDGSGLIYLFLTTRIIGPDGQPVHPDAKPRVQEATPAKK